MQSVSKSPPLTRWRMTDWLLVALVLALIVWAIAPQQLTVSVYKLSLVSMAAVAGYWIDRSLFPYARPDGELARDVLDAKPPIDLGDCGTDDACALAVVSSQVEGRAAIHLLIAAMLRRALIVSAAIVAVSLGA